MNSTNSALGLAVQTSGKGTPETTGFHWLLATEQTTGAQPRIRQLPPEMGAGLMGRGMVKTGVSSLGALRGIPRPASLGMILYGLTGQKSVAGGGPAYTHTFTIDETSPASVPYFTVRRTVGGDFGETFTDCRIASLTMDMAAINFVDGAFTLVGIEPTLVPDVSGWTVTPDAAPPFNAAVGVVKVETGDTITTLPVRAATLTIANQLALDENFIIGSYYPADVDVVFRTITLSFVVLVTDITKYQELMYDQSGAGNDWLPAMFETSNVEHITFKTAEYITGTTPYSLSVTGFDAQWVAEPISMRAGENVLMRVTGTLTQAPTGQESVTLTLVNGTATYPSAP